jgi:hypothetical protein
MDDLVPEFRAEGRKLLWVPMAVRLPVKSLQHDPIVIETGLRVSRFRRKVATDANRD